MGHFIEDDTDSYSITKVIFIILNRIKRKIVLKKIMDGLENLMNVARSTHCQLYMM